MQYTTSAMKLINTVKHKHTGPNTVIQPNLLLRGGEGF